jgi:hypothetical protein
MVAGLDSHTEAELRLAASKTKAGTSTPGPGESLCWEGALSLPKHWWRFEMNREGKREDWIRTGIRDQVRERRTCQAIMSSCGPDFGSKL